MATFQADLRERLWKSFTGLPLEEQKRIAQLGMNANWVIQRLEPLQHSGTEVDKATQAILNALNMGMNHEGRYEPKINQICIEGRDWDIVAE